MPKIKNYGREEEKKLKNVDLEKDSEVNILHLNSDQFSRNTKEPASPKKKNGTRKRLPIAVDIIISVLLIAIVGGVVVGSYFALRYFTVDYESVKIEYALLVEADDASQLTSLTGMHLYKDVDNNTLYMGRVIEVEVYGNDGAALLHIQLTAKYRSNEGYFASDLRIAVGRDLEVRTQDRTVRGSIVELKRLSEPQRTYAVTKPDGIRTLCITGGEG